MDSRAHIDLLNCITGYNLPDRQARIKKLSENIPLLLKLYYNVNNTLPPEILNNPHVNNTMSEIILNNCNYTVEIKTKKLTVIKQDLNRALNNNKTIKIIIDKIMFELINKKILPDEKLEIIKKQGELDTLLMEISTIYMMNPNKIRLILIEDMAHYGKKAKYCKQLSKLKINTPCFKDTYKAYCSDVITRKTKKNNTEPHTMKKKHRRRKFRH